MLLAVAEDERSLSSAAKRKGGGEGKEDPVRWVSVGGSRRTACVMPRQVLSVFVFMACGGWLAWIRSSGLVWAAWFV